MTAVSRRWLEGFLQRPLPTAELIPRLAMLGAPADAVVPLNAALRDVVVALVEEVRPHPNADRLLICAVNDGTPVRKQVVTGAPNAAAGKKYPFAAIGVTLPTGLKLEKRKLRGELSEGMLCSPDELGLGAEHDGLMVLDTGAAPGTPFAEALELDDDQLILDISPVRPDLLGHKGIARELAASYRSPFRLPAIPGIEAVDVPPFRRSAEPVATGGFTVRIEPGAACRRFTAGLIRGVKVGPSPAWLRGRLESVGSRSINNVVDATNYVMLELGQPLHAFDADKVAGSVLLARLARPGETLVTLDGQPRALAGSMTVVADAERAVGVAGIMGGRESEVSDSTVNVLLECAWWEPKEVRRTRRALGIVTEASTRFERGTDLWGLPDALRRTAQIIVAIAGGTMTDEPADLWPVPTSPPRIFLRLARVTRVLGVELPVHVIEQCLVAIGATVVAKPEDGRLAVDVPGWRPDLVAEVDLIEEVARIYGYDKLPDDLRPFRLGNQADAPGEVVARRVRAGMVAEGLFEVVNMPIGPADAADAVRVLNPLSADHGHLRQTLLPGLVRQVEVNWAARTRDVRLFEIGTVFEAGETGGRPVEATRLGGIVTGAREPAHWTAGGQTPDADLWDLKGHFERAVGLANPRAQVQVEGDRFVAKRPDGRVIGWARGLSADAPPWAAGVFGFEIEIEPVIERPGGFTPLPTVPASTRDLALLVPPGVSAERIADAIRKIAGGLLESGEVIDEYRGAGLPANRRSVAFRLTFRGRDRTLRDVEVDSAVTRIIGALEKQLDVALRSS
ncbi:MAG: phenylalanine--tRNA ligase subunit beta [Gemmatimonadota bacterium]